MYRLATIAKELSDKLIRVAAEKQREIVIIENFPREEIHINLSLEDYYGDLFLVPAY